VQGAPLAACWHDRCLPASTTGTSAALRPCGECAGVVWALCALLLLVELPGLTLLQCSTAAVVAQTTAQICAYVHTWCTELWALLACAAAPEQEQQCRQLGKHGVRSRLIRTQCGVLSLVLHMFGRSSWKMVHQVCNKALYRQLWEMGACHQTQCCSAVSRMCQASSQHERSL
jgi:hypothetical protein